MAVEFIFGEEKYKLFDQKKVANWIDKVIREEKKQLGEVSYKFVSDDEILEVNKEFLNHDYFTDIITFDECFVNIINGVIFISMDTVKTNSQILKNSFLQELLRVIIHGIMHLCGFNDLTDEEKKVMRKMEDKYLSYLEKL